MRTLESFVEFEKFGPADLTRLRDKLFLEGDKRRINLQRFAALLFLSVVIATYGVIGDSTATVIGAMLIAPLMTPIMGTAFGLVTGDMRRAGRAVSTVVAGVAGAIFTAWCIGTFLTTSVISFGTNLQIVGRVSPNLTDLAVALASGAAGAFAVSRSDVADSLPGVAISVALVPPLAVVGLGLSEHEWTVAWGAMLLFLTNFLSILLAGGGTLAFLGLSTAATKSLTGPARRRAFVSIAIGTLVLAIPLAATSYTVARESLAEIQTREFVQEWLSETDFELTRITVKGEEIEVIINGDGLVPPLLDLGTNLQTTVDPRVQLKLIVVPSQHISFPEA